MRISRPLIGTAVGAGALGATLALGLTMASASAGAAPSTVTSRSAATTSSAASPSATPKPAQGSGHKCPGMSGRGAAPHSTQQG